MLALLPHIAQRALLCDITCSLQGRSTAWSGLNPVFPTGFNPAGSGWCHIPLTLQPAVQGALARIFHQIPTAAAPGQALCRVHSFAALNVLHEYAYALLSRELHRSRTLERPRYGIW